MSHIKYLLFDCMETLIDMSEIPGLNEDALWAFEGSGNESYWDNFEEFFNDYQNAKATLSETFPEHQEYNMRERYRLAMKNKIPENNGLFENMIEKFSRNFWARYKSKCYIQDEVKPVLAKLSANYKMGIVSNFKISGGVEELLVAAGIAEFFEFKIISVNVGWRKPNSYIYQLAKEMTGLTGNEILFIGDDYECDYIGPKNVGMNSILLDRQNRYPHIQERIIALRDLEKQILK